MTGDILWGKIEQALNLVIPNHLKYIFKIQSIDHPLILSELDEEELSSIRGFVRSETFARMISKDSDHSNITEHILATTSSSLKMTGS